MQQYALESTAYFEPLSSSTSRTHVDRFLLFLEAASRNNATSSDFSRSDIVSLRNSVFAMGGRPLFFFFMWHKIISASRLRQALNIFSKEKKRTRGMEEPRVLCFSGNIPTA